MSVTMTAKVLSPEELREAIELFLEGRDTGYLGTHSSDDLRVSPVKFYVDDNLDVYIHSRGGSKFVNLQENQDVCLLVCTSFQDDLSQIKGVQIFGTAEVGTPGSPLYEMAEELCPWSHEEDFRVIKIKTEEVVYVDRLSEDEIKQVWRP